MNAICVNVNVNTKVTLGFRRFVLITYMVMLWFVLITYVVMLWFVLMVMLWFVLITCMVIRGVTRNLNVVPGKI